MRSIHLKEIELMDSPKKRFRGLMLRKEFDKPLVFVFSSQGRYSNSIHSLFCRVEFDAVFLDSKKKVVEVIEKIKPFKLLIVPKRECNYLIEFPAGSVRKLGVKEGMMIYWKE
jgi:uncharacterized membrane protein (UPF0127 family)